MPLLIPAHSKLVMIGDSITDCGRARPVGDGRDDALGSGYVGLVNALINSAHPQAQLRIVNMGISGNTIRDLRDRWQADVIDLRPDWLSIMIGVNDVWRQFDSPRQTEQHVSLENYTRTLTELVAVTCPQVKGLVLMTPFFIEPNRAEPMRAMLDRYGQVVRNVAAAHDAVLVDTQSAFDAILQYVHPMVLAPDRVHPTPTGHMVLARAFLNAVSFTW